MFQDGPKLPLKIRIKILWRERLVRAPLLRLLGGLALLVGGGLFFALFQGDAACCGVLVGGPAALAGLILLSIGLYEMVVMILWAD
ncbi:MAG: hypothetical protein KKA73_08140 [Chloroflexi bacterium]|nr:hypothetical protein [Chloroflexota bacterium]MBU1747644.1 hypothetical protein [Chloroflexota bacterium]MBU1879242.1 hypothetical protein [Chloroflexota bacterium]